MLAAVTHGDVQDVWTPPRDSELDSHVHGTQWRESGHVEYNTLLDIGTIEEASLEIVPRGEKIYRTKMVRTVKHNKKPPATGRKKVYIADKELRSRLCIDKC